jgi:hypothetical protein
MSIFLCGMSLLKREWERITHQAIQGTDEPHKNTGKEIVNI